MDYASFAKRIRGFDDLERKYFNEVLENGQLSIFFNENSMVRRFQDAFQKKTGAKFALARNNGMCALAEAVSISGAGAGFEVLCDPIVHFGGLATLYYDAVPRWIDIKPDDYLMDPASLEANITDRAKAVIVTHLWGFPAEIDRIREICDKHGLFLIEDCAHAINVYYKERHVGTFGDYGMFSLQEFKHLSTGDGAMATLRDGELVDNIENVWAFSGESPTLMTLNWRMNEMTAAMGLAQLERVDDIIDNYYNKTLQMFEDAIAGCEWLTARRRTDDTQIAGYWWSCKWEGDKFGLDYEKFKKLNDEMDLGLRFGFNETAPYEFEFFKKMEPYGPGSNPMENPAYRQNSDYRYRKGLCPVVEDVMPRLITVNLIFLPPEEAKIQAEKLHDAIQTFA